MSFIKNIQIVKGHIQPVVTYNIYKFIFTYPIIQLGAFCNVLVGNVQRIHRFMKYKIISLDKMFLSPCESKMRKYFKHSIQTNEEII